MPMSKHKIMYTFVKEYENMYVCMLTTHSRLQAAEADTTQWHFSNSTPACPPLPLYPFTLSHISNGEDNKICRAREVVTVCEVVKAFYSKGSRGKTAKSSKAIDLSIKLSSTHCHHSSVFTCASIKNVTNSFNNCEWREICIDNTLIE